MAKRTDRREIDAVAELKAHAKPVPMPHGVKSPTGMRYVGTFDESPTQHHVFWEGEGTLMLSIFEFAKQGAMITTFAEFENAQVGSVPATLTLAYVPGRIDAVWVITWILPGDKVQMQLRVPERVDVHGMPEKHDPQSIVALAQEVSR